MAGLTAAVLLAGALTAVPAQAITGGAAAADGALRFAARVTVGDSRGCSGVLVDPGWVLTAASCFPENGKADGAPVAATTAVVGRTSVNGTDGQARRVTELVHRADRNVVLARLDRVVTDITPIRIGAAAVTGEALKIAGYGRTATEWVPERLQVAAVTVRSTADTTVDVDGENPAATTCRGDSGGPAFRDTGAGPELVALHSNSWQGGCVEVSETRTAAVESRVDDLKPWLAQQVTRWAAGNTAWSGRDAAGRPHAFAVRGGVLHDYALTAQGAWASTPLEGAGGPLATAVAVGNNADGRLQVFARRLSDHHIVTTFQVAGGGWAGIWHDFGSPNAGLPSAAEVGVPVVAQNADGRLQLFVRNGGSGVSTYYQAKINGSWNPEWIDLKGRGVRDGLSAVRNPAGRIELFASTPDRLLHYYQPKPNDGLVLNEKLPSGKPLSPPAAALSQDGRIEVAYRTSAAGDVTVSFQSQASGAWNPTPVRIAGAGGTGGLAAVTAPKGADARVMFFGRYPSGLRQAKQNGPNVGYSDWADLAGGQFDQHTAVVDGAGVVTVFALTAEGGVRVRRQGAAGANAPFGDWQSI